MLEFDTLILASLAALAFSPAAAFVIAGLAGIVLLVEMGDE